ncbi:MAG: hypothetical protein ACOC1F_12210 [Myxococcota bacterium]
MSKARRRRFAFARWPFGCKIPLAITFAGASVAATVAGDARASDELESGTDPQAEFSTLAGIATRHASTDDSVNPDGIGYEPAVKLAFQGRGYVWPWLNFAIYYVRASHAINLPRGAADIDYESIDIGNVLAYSLGARLEPTYQVSDEFRTWLSIGVGWGRMSLDEVTVQETNRSYTVRERSGVFVEVPIGIGASYEVIPRWLAIQAEADIAHLSKQSGKLYDTTPYVDSQGSRGTVGPMPTQTVSAGLLLGVSLIL